jgi:chromosomal replication initiator protein
MAIASADRLPMRAEVSELGDAESSLAETLADVWSRVRGRLRAELGDDVFTSWFARIDFEGGEPGVVRLSVPTRFLKTWIQSHYGERLMELWQADYPLVRRVDLTVRTAVRARAAAAPVEEAAAVVRTRPVLSVPAVPEPPAAAPRRTQRPARGERTEALSGSPLDPRFTFASFLEGRTNALALAAAKQVAGARRGEAIAFNPLFVHAPVGFGKTHLLQAIAAEAARSSDRKVLYLTAEHFVFRFVAALRAQTAIDFKESLREIDLLLIDDLQFLQGDRSQEEFCHALNALVDGAGQVVVAGDRPPVELEALDARVRSRLGGGLLVEIGAPDAELRRKILAQRLSAQRAAFPGLSVPSEVVDFVARAVATNGRDLDGAVNRLVAHNQLTGAPITVEMAESVLRDLLRARGERRIRIEDIQRIVARHYNIAKTDLLSARRTQTIVRPRQIAMYLAKTMTPRSLPEIGRRFGGRDHTTVLHAVRKIEELARTDTRLAEEIEALKRLIDE